MQWLSFRSVSIYQLVLFVVSAPWILNASEPYGPREFDELTMTAVVAAYRPEIEAILNEIEKREDTQIDQTLSIKGVQYHLGTFREEPIVVFVTGVHCICLVHFGILHS